MWVRAFGVMVVGCLILGMLDVPSEEYHRTLVALANRFPVLQRIGQLFHNKAPAGDSSKREIKPETKPSKNKEGHNWMDGPRDLTIFREENIKYVEGETLYLVIIGHVFDVTEGKNYYKPGSGYFGFIGRDSSRSFVTGHFEEEGLTSDVSGLSSSDYLALADWLKFYLDHEKYIHVGYLQGRFFDEGGIETDEMAKLKEWVRKARSAQDSENDLKKIFPPCNVDWNKDNGTTFHCSKMSGGVERDWIGVPRQFFPMGSEIGRCACVHPNYLADARVKLYKMCDPQAISCKPEST